MSSMSKSQESAMEKYYNALKIFYESKKKYEEELKKKKNKIKNDKELTISQKRKQIREIKMKCIKCKKDVGTKFIINKDEYRVICGGGLCDPNIVIRKIQFIDGREILTSIDNEIKDIQDDIITTKLNFLFELIDDETVTTEFDEFKKEYNEYSKTRSIIKKILQWKMLHVMRLLKN